MGVVPWIAGALCLLVGIFLMYPEPKLTPKLLEWKNSGTFTVFKGFNIFYKVVKGKRNDGSTLLCLHGFPTSSYDWIKVLDPLKEEFSQIILYDYLGFGLSDKPENHTYSIMEQADIGEAVLKLLGVTKIHLLSHDYGDTVALEFLARHNNKENKDGIPVIQSLCLTNGGIFPETNFPRPLQKMLLNPYIGPVISRLTNYFMFSKGFGEIFGPQTVPDQDELWDFYVGIQYKQGYRLGYKLIHYITERTKYKERWVGGLKSTSVKVHMIFGDSDPVNPSSFADFYKKTVPQHGITVLKHGIGHYPQWEAPEDVSEAYLKFIAGLR